MPAFASPLSGLIEVVQQLNLPLFLSIASSCLTFYFWLVKLNRERAGLRLYRLVPFRPDRLQCSPVPGSARAIWYGDIFLANPSTLPAAVVRCRVQLDWKGSWRDGSLQLEKKEDVPWVVEPLRVFVRTFGCCFQVEEETPREQLQKPHRLRFLLETVDGRTHVQEIQTCDAAPAQGSAQAA
jgi:hypothetical protein